MSRYVDFIEIFMYALYAGMPQATSIGRTSVEDNDIENVDLMTLLASSSVGIEKALD